MIKLLPHYLLQVQQMALAVLIKQHDHGMHIGYREHTSCIVSRSSSLKLYFCVIRYMHYKKKQVINNGQNLKFNLCIHCITKQVKMQRCNCILNSSAYDKNVTLT